MCQCLPSRNKRQRRCYVIRKLKSWGVKVIFEREGFDTNSYITSSLLETLNSFGNEEKDEAAGDEFIDDRVIRIFWRCGIVSTVPSGVKNDKDDPQYLVERYQNYLKKQAAKAIADKALTEVVETGMTGVTSTVSKVGTNAVGSRRAAGAVRAVKTVGASS